MFSQIDWLAFLLFIGTGWGSYAVSSAMSRNPRSDSLGWWWKSPTTQEDVGLTASNLLKRTDGRSNRKRYRWMPRPIVFGIAWAIIYSALGVSAFLVWQAGAVGEPRWDACNALYIVLLALLTLYLPAVTRYRSPIAGLVLVALALATTAALIGICVPYSIASIVLYSAVAAWLVFALYLSVRLAITESTCCGRSACATC